MSILCEMKTEKNVGGILWQETTKEVPAPDMLLRHIKKQKIHLDNMKFLFSVHAALCRHPVSNIQMAPLWDRPYLHASRGGG